MLTKICKKCGKKIIKKPSEGIPYWNTKKFCSNKCAVEYNLNSDYYEDRVNYPKIKITRKQFLDRSRNENKNK